MSGSVLFFSVGLNFIPLIRAVAERGFTPFVHSQIAPLLEDAGFPFQVVESFIPPHIQSHVEGHSRLLAEKLSRNLGSSSVRGAFSSSKGDFLSFAGDGFFQQLLGLLTNEIIVLETMEALTRRHDLGLIVMGCDNSPNERVMVDYACQRGIPTLQLAHAIYTRPLARIAGEHKLYSDSIAVYGIRAKEIMVEYGIEPERIFTTGAPAWDVFYRPEAMLSREEARGRLGLEPERPSVLYCSAYADGSSAFYPALARRLMEVHRALAGAVGSMGDDVELMVRPHPNELSRAGLSGREAEGFDEAYLRHLRESGVERPILLRNHKVEALRAADLVVAVGSSSIIAEAMILGRPVVVAPWFEQEELIYTEDDGIRVAHGGAELEGAVSGLVGDEARRKEMVRRQTEVLGELNHGNDGRATERVADLVGELSGRASKRRPEPRPRARRAPEDGSLDLIYAAQNFLPYGVGGTERYTCDLAREMVRRGHRVRVLYPRYVTEDPGECSVREGSFEGLDVVEVLTSKNAFALVRNEALKEALRPYLAEDPPELVHAQHLMGLSVSFVELLEELGVPFVFTANDFWFLCQQLHLVEPSGTVCTGPETMDKCVACMSQRLGGAPEEQLPRLFHYMAERYYTQRRAVKGLKLVLCPSKFLMDTFLRYGFGSLQTVHAPQGANLLEPKERPPRAVPPLVFSYVGTVDHRKGTDLAVEAFNRIETGEAELRIYGNVADQTYFQRVMESVGEGKPVTYHGEYGPHDLPDILASTDVAIVPSRGENYPFVIREILNARVPVIASDVAGIPEMVKDGVNGLLFRGNDAGDLAAKMEMLIGEPSLVETLREGIEPVKSIAQEAEEMEERYRGLLEREGGSLPSHQAEPAEVRGDEGPAVSVVIVTYNSASTIRACLDTVLASSPASAEVVVVDNASRDETRSLLGDYEGRITTVLNEENLGFSRACNQGIEACPDSSHVVLLNPDTAVTPGWIERLSAHFGADVGAVGPVSNCVAANQYVGRFMPGGREGQFGMVELAELLYNANRGRAAEAKLLIGFCIMLSRRALEDVGLLDEDLFLGNDDLDISWRLRLAGWRLLVATDTFVYHEGQVSFRSEEESRTSTLIQRSTDRLYEKLVAYYGDGRVPHPMELWGIDWFRPSGARFLSGPQEAETDLTSIIILTHNQLDHTKLCLQSIEAHTPEPHELIIVDNGSSDGTVEFLRGYSAGRRNVRVVANSSNRGFAAGNNQGMALARGGYVLLLNNDTVVNDGWLARMLAVFEREDRVGIVGPMSNYVSGPQLVKQASYSSLAEMEAFAERWAEEHAGQTLPIMRVVGFCLLARREVIERIGGLDERFGSGNFEDDDFCARAARAGYEARIAKDVFIHHTGSQTFKGAKIDFRRAMLKNWRLFKLKWGIPASTPMEGTYHLPARPPPEVDLPVALPDIGASHSPDQEGRWWREVESAPERARVLVGIVGEGPGMDETREVFQRFCPEAGPLSVWDGPASVNKDFGRADYLALLDPGVVLTRPWLSNMLAVADSDGSLAAVGPTSNAASEAPQAVKPAYKSLKKALQKFASRRARQHKDSWQEVPRLDGFCLLLRSSAALAVGGLSEELPWGEALPDLFARLKAGGMKLACALGAYVHHEGPVVQEGPPAGEVPSWDGSAEERLEEAHAALERGELERAADLFDEVSLLVPDLATAHWGLGSTLLALDRLEEGVVALRRAAELAPKEASLQNQLGVALYHTGRLDEAERAFVAAHREASEDVDVLLNLVELYRCQERFGEAADHLRLAHRLAPLDSEILSALGAISMELGDRETARKALEHLQAAEPDHPEIQPLRRALEA